MGVSTRDIEWGGTSRTEMDDEDRACGSPPMGDVNAGGQTGHPSSTTSELTFDFLSIMEHNTLDDINDDASPPNDGMDDGRRSATSCTKVVRSVDNSVVTMGTWVPSANSTQCGGDGMDDVRRGATSCTKVVRSVDNSDVTMGTFVPFANSTQCGGGWNMFNVQRHQFEQVPHGMAHHFGGSVGRAEFCDPGQFSMGQMTMECNFMHGGGGQYGNNVMQYMTQGQQWWHHQLLNSESGILNRGIINNDLSVVGDGIRDHRDETHFRGSPWQVYQRSSVGADVFDVGNRNCAQQNDVQGVNNGGSGAGVNGKVSVIQGKIMKGSIFVGTSSTSNAKDGFEWLSNILFVINSIEDDSARVIQFTVKTREAFQC